MPNADANTLSPHEVLQILTQRALAHMPVAELHEEAARLVMQALGADGCGSFECLPDDMLAIRAAVGWEPAAPTLSQKDSPLLNHVLHTQPALWSNDLKAEPRFEQTRFSEARSLLGAAVPGEEAPIGALIAFSKQPAAFEEKDLFFLQSVASLLASVMAWQSAESALQASQAQVHAILDTTVDGIISIDAKGLVLAFNKAAERIFGYEVAEVIGRNISMLMPEPYYSEHDAYLEAYHTTGRRKIIGIGREVMGRRKDGTVFPMYLGVSEVQWPDQVIFTGLVRDITEQRRLEQEVLRVTEEERRRIGQDLHDGLGQMLTGTGLIASNVAKRLRRQEVAGADEVAEVAEMVKDADQYARSLARGLVPVELEQGGLRGALERLARNAKRLFGIQCTFHERGANSITDSTVAMHLYRIAQESVSNAVRHGRASEVIIRLNTVPAYVRLRIEDNGEGFTDVSLDGPPESFSDLHGMGVRIMHYRARIIGATLDIQGIAGEGTVVTCTLRRFNHATNP